MSKHKKTPDNNIALNRKALYDYEILQKFDAGLVLQGWEMKSIRAGRVNLKEAYILVKEGEAWLVGAHISPLTSASTHVDADPVRTRKLLLHKEELKKLIGQTQEKGLTIVPLSLYWKRQLVKLNIALVKGKKAYDKRASEKSRDWQREKARIMKSHDR